MCSNHSYLLKLLVIVSLFFWVQCLPSHAASSEKRVALVIGNSAYQNTPALPNPRNDAMEVGKVLKRLGFEVDVQVDLTKQNMDKVLRQFGDRLEGAQVAVFYYAGHGIQVAGTNYLIPIDASLRKEKDLYFEVSELNLVLQQMEGSQRVNLVFLDACRDNPMSNKLAEGMGSGRSTLIGRGLAPMKASDGTLISYATKDGEVASDGKGKHSPYSQAILNHIEAPMEISQMLRKVREDVKKLTDNRQTPWEYGSLTGDFYFTGPVKVEISQEPTKSDSRSKLEALYWQSIMNDTDPAVFESYLKKYPDGEFSDLAKIKIINLKKGQKNEVLPSSAQPVQPDLKKAFGHLKLTSDPPGASVLLDGNPLGNTDLDASNIEPGKRKIEIQKDCFKLKTAEVLIKAGQQVSMNLKLEPSCGGITATSDPTGADLLIDNKPVGITPAEVMGISEGKHQITIRKDGFQDWQDGMIVKSGKTIAIKSGKLKPAPVVQQKASDTADQPPVPQSEYRLTVDANPADAKIKLLNTPTKYKKGMMLKPGTYQMEISRDGYEPYSTIAEIKDTDVVLPVYLKEMARGSILVTSDPSGASVLMDGKKIGITPLDLTDISSGQKKITVEKNGYKPAMQTTSVKSGQQTQLDVKLETLGSVVHINSDPSGAEVYIDDHQSGTTPVELKNVLAGIHRVVVKKDGYLDFSQVVTSEPKKPTQIHAGLIRNSQTKSNRFDNQANDVIQDNRTGLKWVVGPEKDMNWAEAEIWANNLRTNNCKGRMPEKAELQYLYEKGNKPRNLDPVFKMTGWSIWAAEQTYSRTAWSLNLLTGEMVSNLKLESKDHRAFAVCTEKASQSAQPSSSPSSQSVSSSGTLNILSAGYVESFSGSGLDSTRWEQWNSDNRYVTRQYGNGLILSGGAKEKAEGGVFSKFYLTGNFIVEVSYEILKWPFYENPQLDRQKRAFLKLYLSNGKKGSDRFTVNLARYNSPTATFEGYSTAWLSKGKWYEDYLPKHLSHSKGKLRLKRTNGKFEAFYDESGEWKSLPGYQDNYDLPVAIGLSICNFSSERKVDPTEVEVRFTDLKINMN